MGLSLALSLSPLTLRAAEEPKRPASPPEPGLQALRERQELSRATEAVIWGMSAVNYDLMRQTMLKVTDAKENDFLYWSRPADWKNQTLTPNPDSIYFISFWNTHDTGPLVLEVPPAEGGSFAGNIVDVWQMPLEDAGPQGADEGKGGKYLILPPGYRETPPPGYIVLRPATYGGFALMRSNLLSHGEQDIAKSVAYGKQLKFYPLSQAAQPPATRFVDAEGILFDSTIPFDTRFFTSLDRMIQQEPWLDRDRVMIDLLKTLGIEKGKPFHPDEARQKRLAAAARDARELLAARYDEGFGRWTPQARWFPAAMPEVAKAVQSGYADPNAYPVDGRGVIYTLGFTGIKRLGTAQFYLMGNKDAAGRDLHGAKTYRLHVPADPPVGQYWSVTAYDRATHALIREMPHASRASISEGIRKNEDGSVDVYFGPSAPADKEGNWVPTDPKGEFELLFRLYGPEKPFFEKTWVLPDLTELKE